ncbi:hypothetical protein AY599_03265 [Leptolyngbya valderiana BDU 20041]|nr:hypothetical protein AY599_03265 [Leptolyngbya valderiana BDU 20041]
MVGINTSGFIEAGIVGRRTFTLATDHFADTQEGTLHFHYLVQGGLLTKAETFDAHLEQLKEAFDDPRKAQQEVRAFVRDFVRPHGLEDPATPGVVRAMLSAAELKSIGWRSLPAARLLRPLARRLLAGLREQQLGSRRANAWYDMELVTRAQALRARRTTAPVDGTAALTFEEESLGRQLIAAAKAKGQILVTAWNGPPELEALYFVPFLRWMRQLCNLEPDRLTVLSRNLPQAWFADITPNVVAVPRKVVPDEEPQYARRKTSATIAQTVEARAVENIVELYRDGIIGMANWLDHARYVVRPRSLDTSSSGSILIDQNGVPAAALERAVAVLRDRGITIRTTGRGPKEASTGGAPGCVSHEAIPEAVSSATAVIGPLGPAIAAAVQCGAPAHVLAQPGRAAALDYAVLAQMAQEAGGPIYRYEVAAFEIAVELATRTHETVTGQPQFA